MLDQLFIFSLSVFPGQLACHKANLPPQMQSTVVELTSQSKRLVLRTVKRKSCFPPQTIHYSFKLPAELAATILCLPSPANIIRATFFTQTICKIFKLPAELAATNIFVFCPQQTLETKLPSSLPTLVPQIGSEDPNA